jgi:hypothetical protein
MGGGVYKSLILRCKLLFFFTQFVLFSKTRRDILHVAFASVFQNTGKLEDTLNLQNLNPNVYMQLRTEERNITNLVYSVSSKGYQAT